MILGLRNAALKFTARLWLTWPIDLTVVITFGLVYALVPQRFVDSGGSSPYFTSVAQVSVTLLVAIALFGGAIEGVVEYNVRKWANARTFGYVGVAVATGLLGSLGSTSGTVQRAFLALSACGCAGALGTVLLMGHSNIAQRRQDGVLARAAVLDQRSPTVPTADASPQDTGGESKRLS